MRLQNKRWLSSILAGSIFSGLFAQPVVASSFLTDAEVYDFSSQVHLQKAKQRSRFVKIGDVMVPMDLLITGSDAWAKLHFNDGTLFRVGSGVKFFFVPQSRSFQLKNGIILRR